MRISRLVPLALLSSVLLGPATALGDAIVVTKAMTASTIAEIFVEPTRVRVELEIGLADIPAFRNVLPDEEYERLGMQPTRNESTTVSFPG